MFLSFPVLDAHLSIGTFMGRGHVEGVRVSPALSQPWDTATVGLTPKLLSKSSFSIYCIYLGDSG